MTASTTLALLGGDPVEVPPLPTYPALDEGALGRIAEVLESTQRQGLSKGHPVIREAEETFASFHGVGNCLWSSSGHGALQSALIGLEITGGDHVLTSPYSWGASVSCILHNGAVPVFADVDPLTGLLDPATLEQSLTSRTTAILVPHLYGQPADMTAICEFAARHGLKVIEDGSQAHGARHRGVRIGSFGDAAGFSTNGVKPIATNEGGYMLSREADPYWKACLSCQHAGRGELIGRASEPGFPDELRPFIDSLVYTYRPNVITAVLALERLKSLDRENAARRANAAEFLANIAEIGYLEAPEHDEGDECVFHMVTLNVDPERAGVSRDTYLRALQAEGVGAVAYVERALNQSPRLSPDWDGPRVMWTEGIRASGIDPTAVELPGCARKIERSIEIPWNIPLVDPDLTRALADAFWKLDANLDALRKLERDAAPAL
jgi:dTDP-4-amino-4,6-dideoxygalactose transaminase